MKMISSCVNERFQERGKSTAMPSGVRIFIEVALKIKICHVEDPKRRIDRSYKQGRIHGNRGRLGRSSNAQTTWNSEILPTDLPTYRPTRHTTEKEQKNPNMLECRNEP